MQCFNYDIRNRTGRAQKTFIPRWWMIHYVPVKSLAIPIKERKYSMNGVE